MTTDPRVIECANRLRGNLETGPGRRLGMFLSEQQAADIAQTVILKWLEQDMTEEMAQAGYRGVERANGVPLTGGMKTAYAHVCTQAAKEITG